MKEDISNSPRFHNIALMRILVEEEFVSELPGSEILDSAKDTPITILARKGEINEVDALEAVADKLQIPFIDLENSPLREKFAVAQFFRRIPIDLCKRYNVAPLFTEDDHLIVATSNPLLTDGVNAIRFILSMPIRPYIAEQKKIEQLISSAAKDKTRAINTLCNDIAEADSKEEEEKNNTIEIQNQQRILSELSAKPVVRLVQQILSGAIDAHASDVHLEPAQDGLVVKYRIDGAMREILRIPDELKHRVIGRCKIISSMDITQHSIPQDGRASVLHKRESIPLRVSSIPTANGEKLVFRVLAENALLNDISRLGFTPDIRGRIEGALSKHAKIILVTGPTGSGKTTSLYSCLHHLRDGKTNIATIENPVEYRLPGINQTEISSKVQMTFASALRSLLRQDPDVIMIGEIRDSETAEIAFQAAETGHKVLSTLHTIDAPSSISRLKSLGVSNYLIASSLQAILTQRLVRKLCPECRGERELNQEERQRFDGLGIELKSIYFGIGCERCEHTGYLGRSGIYSYFDCTPSVAEMISQDCPISALCHEAKKHGYRELWEDGVRLLRQGVTSLEEVGPYLPTLAQLRNVVAISSGRSLEPIELARKSKPKKETSVSSPQSEPSSCEGERLLLVEDNITLRSMFEWILKKEGFKVTTAENGQEAISVLSEFDPQLVICDSLMPVMDGREFVKYLRASEGYQELPIVILTAEESEDAELDYLELGVSDFIRKSSDTQIIVARIQRLLSKGITNLNGASKEVAS